MTQHTIGDHRHIQIDSLRISRIRSGATIDENDCQFVLMILGIQKELGPMMVSFNKQLRDLVMWQHR